MGSFSGKLGPAVGYRWRGKWVLRSLAMPNNPRTAEQQAHRELFKQQVQLAGHLKMVLPTTFDAVSMAVHMTPFNYFVHRNQHAFSAVDGQLTVDWGALVLSEGPVAPVAFTGLEVTHGTTLTVSFDRSARAATADKFDRVYLYVYVPELNNGYLSAPAYRKDGQLGAVLPERYAGREVQLWGMVQDRTGRWSETIYIGHGPLDDGLIAAAEETDNEPPADGDGTAGATAAATAQQTAATAANRRPPDVAPHELIE